MSEPRFWRPLDEGHYAHGPAETRWLAAEVNDRMTEQQQELKELREDVRRALQDLNALRNRMLRMEVGNAEDQLYAWAMKYSDE